MRVHLRQTPPGSGSASDGTRFGAECGLGRPSLLVAMFVTGLVLLAVFSLIVALSS